jgi:hypothetical protein
MHAMTPLERAISVEFDEDNFVPALLAGGGDMTRTARSAA